MGFTRDRLTKEKGTQILGVQGKECWITDNLAKKLLLNLHLLVDSSSAQRSICNVKDQPSGWQFLVSCIMSLALVHMCLMVLLETSWRNKSRRNDKICTFLFFLNFLIIPLPLFPRGCDDTTSVYGACLKLDTWLWYWETKPNSLGSHAYLTGRLSASELSLSPISSIYTTGLMIVSWQPAINPKHLPPPHLPPHPPPPSSSFFLFT